MTETMNLSPDAVVSLREVTAETVRTICKLSDTLSDAQKHMVAPNAVSIAEAHFSEHAWFRAIYADDVPVGFVMLYIGPSDDDPSRDVHFLWRYMIAGPHQGKGYGRRALQMVIDDLKAQGVKEFLTSCGEGEASPEGFYHSLGFERDGNVYGDEVGLRLVISK